MTNPSSFTNLSRRLLAFIERNPAADVAEFPTLAHELFALQFEHVAPYRRLCEARRVTPDKLADWRHIPAMPTTAFKELELTSLAPAGRTTVFHSSGTTEHRPSRHWHSTESLAVYEASLLRWFEWHLLPDVAGLVASPAGRPAGALGQTRAAFLCLAPPPAQAPRSSLVHMFATASHAFGAPGSCFVGAASADNSWSLDFASALAALRHAEQSGQPIFLLGTAFMFVRLLDAMSEQGLFLKLPPGSRVMETGGYKGRSRELSKAGLHGLITARLGVPPKAVVCEYGMSELSSQAYSLITNHSSLPFRFPPWCRALVIAPETGREVAEGETGLLRIYDLANVRSVLAIQTEDLAVRHSDGFELIGRASQAEARGCSLLAA